LKVEHETQILLGDDCVNKPYPAAHAVAAVYGKTVTVVETVADEQVIPLFGVYP